MGILEGRAIVITGAGPGLGEAYALHAARSGACVVVNDVDGELAEAVADRIVLKGGRAVFSALSVRDPGQARPGQRSRCCVVQAGVPRTSPRPLTVSWITTLNPSAWRSGCPPGCQ